jgi:hypothetical protein
MNRYTTNTLVTIALLSMGVASPAAAESFKDKVVGHGRLKPDRRTSRTARS